jgi:8-oxo-dGTP diphosphatase
MRSPLVHDHGMDFLDYDTRLAAYAAIVDGERMLLTWYNGQGHGDPCWTMPGGGVEFDESPEKATEREVLEETGYVVSVGTPLAVHHATKPDGGNGRPYKAVRVVFDAAIVAGSLGTTEIGGSTDFAEWVPLDHVGELTPRADIVDVALRAVARRGAVPRTSGQDAGVEATDAPDPLQRR